MHCVVDSLSTAETPLPDGVATAEHQPTGRQHTDRNPPSRNDVTGHGGAGIDQFGVPVAVRDPFGQEFF
ncbi:hypothetical protein AW168_35330 [Nocardia brasiliensis]|nr:hypothetical protein AW168_35330 [Nocardia brasiliensis]